jgi:hypothetical protein
VTPEQEKQMQDAWKLEWEVYGIIENVPEIFRAAWTRRQPEIDALTSANAALGAERDALKARAEKAEVERDLAESDIASVQAVTNAWINECRNCSPDDAGCEQCKQLDKCVVQIITAIEAPTHLSLRATVASQAAEIERLNSDISRIGTVENNKRILMGKIESQKAEIERLRAVVERLPKTADGVPIPCKTVVWYIHPSGEVNMTTMDASGFSPRGFCAEKNCYSTREAALAARKEAK